MVEGSKSEKEDERMEGNEENLGQAVEKPKSNKRK